ncbi:hypothetical protein IWQ62_002553 [Dispira parvispora]|uniref:Uncharacterized protein n=1 Tax=Dispira parvispora TaxID=1520584 RepID=A0A9W8E7W2_9FUNG|nr:hypothetical protein IWQ62_002553 [Dispira parvispora]
MYTNSTFCPVCFDDWVPGNVVQLCNMCEQRINQELSMFSDDAVKLYSRAYFTIMGHRNELPNKGNETYYRFVTLPRIRNLMRDERLTFDQAVLSLIRAPIMADDRYLNFFEYNSMGHCQRHELMSMYVKVVHEDLLKRVMDYVENGKQLGNMKPLKPDAQNTINFMHALIPLHEWEVLCSPPKR